MGKLLFSVRGDNKPVGNNERDVAAFFRRVASRTSLDTTPLVERRQSQHAMKDSLVFKARSKSLEAGQPQSFAGRGSESSTDAGNIARYSDNDDINSIDEPAVHTLKQLNINHNDLAKLLNSYQGKDPDQGDAYVLQLFYVDNDEFNRIHVAGDLINESERGKYNIKPFARFVWDGARYNLDKLSIENSPVESNRAETHQKKPFSQLLRSQDISDRQIASLLLLEMHNYWKASMYLPLEVSKPKSRWQTVFEYALSMMPALKAPLAINSLLGAWLGGWSWFIAGVFWIVPTYFYLESVRAFMKSEGRLHEFARFAPDYLFPDQSVSAVPKSSYWYAFLATLGQVLMMEKMTSPKERSLFMLMAAGVFILNTVQLKKFIKVMANLRNLPESYFYWQVELITKQFNAFRAYNNDAAVKGLTKYIYSTRIRSPLSLSLAVTQYMQEAAFTKKIDDDQTDEYQGGFDTAGKQGLLESGGVSPIQTKKVQYLGSGRKFLGVDNTVLFWGHVCFHAVFGLLSNIFGVIKFPLTVALAAWLLPGVNMTFNILQYVLCTLIALASVVPLFALNVNKVSNNHQVRSLHMNTFTSNYIRAVKPSGTVVSSVLGFLLTLMNAIFITGLVAINVFFAKDNVTVDHNHINIEPHYPFNSPKHYALNIFFILAILDAVLLAISVKLSGGQQFIKTIAGSCGRAKIKPDPINAFIDKWDEGDGLLYDKISETAFTFTSLLSQLNLIQKDELKFENEPVTDKDYLEYVDNQLGAAESEPVLHSRGEGFFVKPESKYKRILLIELALLRNKTAILQRYLEKKNAPLQHVYDQFCHTPMR